MRNQRNLIKTFLTSVCLLICFIAFGKNVSPVSIHLEVAGTLPTLIDLTKKFLITDLTVTGNINGTDLVYIREMAGRDINGDLTTGSLLQLDLSGSNIVEGESNNFTCRTKTNRIPLNIFKSCSGLISIKIPKTVTTIDSYVFQNCTGLKTIEIPENVTRIGYGAFFECTGLTSISFPNDLSVIEDNTFNCCTSLTSVTLPDSLSEIGSSAFYGCTGLTSITIPKNVHSINNEAFYGCTSADTLIFNAKECIIRNNVFPNTTIKKVFLGKDVTIIPPYIFFDFTNITSIDLPESITHIGSCAFFHCIGLKSIIIPKNVVAILNDAFNSCIALTSITIPESVTYIGPEAFSNCTKLASITIPENLTLLEEATFSNCTHLTEIHSHLKNALPIRDDVFSFVDKGDCILYVPEGSLDSYQNTDVWRSFVNIVEEARSAVSPTSKSKTNVYTNKDAIVVKDANSGDIISIYTLSGTLIKRIIMTEDLIHIKVPLNSIYLVKINEKIFKIAL